MKLPRHFARWLLVALAAGWILTGSPGSMALAATTVTLSPSSDTTLFESSPDNNMGESSEIVAGSTATGHRSRALIKFNLAGIIPPDAMLVSATLTLNAVKEPLGAVASTFEIRRVLVSWTEGTKSTQTGQPATSGETSWSHRSTPSAPWSAAGGQPGVDFAASASATTPIGGLGSHAFASSAGIVSDIQFWLTNPGANFGWILVTQSEASGKSAKRFGSRESGAGAPRLVIEYTLPSPPVITSHPLPQSVAIGEMATFSVTADGAPPLTYRWLFNGAEISGETSPSLTLLNVQPVHAGTYHAVVGNGSGAVPSEEAFLAVSGGSLGYEGDVAPRSGGNNNGLVTIVDWVQVGRFAAGLDVPATSNEFQRADCSPRSGFGNGVLSVADWVQAGRYAAGLDPVVQGAGPSAPP